MDAEPQRYKIQKIYFQSALYVNRVLSFCCLKEKANNEGKENNFGVSALRSSDLRTEESFSDGADGSVVMVFESTCKVAKYCLYVNAGQLLPGQVVGRA